MLLDVPDIRQSHREWSCGRAILEQIYSYWGIPPNKTLLELCNPIQGLAPETLDAALRASKFAVMSGSMTLASLKALSKIAPIACLIQYDEGGHWVLCRGVERNRVYYNCPIRGKLSVPVSEWVDNWKDFHWLGCEYNNWGTCAILGD